MREELGGTGSRAGVRDFERLVPNFLSNNLVQTNRQGLDKRPQWKLLHAGLDVP